MLSTIKCPCNTSECRAYGVFISRISQNFSTIVKKVKWPYMNDENLGLLAFLREKIVRIFNCTAA